MTLPIFWQQGSTNPENATNFAIIQQWFANLNSKQITWKQRLILPTVDVREIDWESQRFDEVFTIKNPQIRGITLYLQKPDSQQERSTTAYKLELDNLHQSLYVYPQSQKEVVIQISLLELIYQTIELTSSEFEFKQKEGNSLLIFRDAQQKLAVKVTLSREDVLRLKQQLP